MHKQTTREGIHNTIQHHQSHHANHIPSSAQTDRTSRPTIHNHTQPPPERLKCSNTLLHRKPKFSEIEQFEKEARVPMPRAKIDQLVVILCLYPLGVILFPKWPRKWKLTNIFVYFDTISQKRTCQMLIKNISCTKTPKRANCSRLRDSTVKRDCLWKETSIQFLLKTIC